MANDILIFIPTYNEKENVERLLSEIIRLGVKADILFVDDNSPDGTGNILDRLSQQYANVVVQHRATKSGIGSAHQDGIKWAYEHHYKILVTMDADFTHSPKDILRFLAQEDAYAVIVGSRFLNKNSLESWNIVRKILTHLGHFVTKNFLRVPYDATGALRLYRLNKIPQQIFSLIRSPGYAFFFESLYVFHLNRFTIKEIPIDLPSRTYGNSKMDLSEVIKTFKRLLNLWIMTIQKTKIYLLPSKELPGAGQATVQQEWDDYWNQKQSPIRKIYDKISSFYREFIIKRSLNDFGTRYFHRGDQVLHAGCGSGQVDADLGQHVSITAMDISKPALEIYKHFNDRGRVIQGNIFDMPFEDKSFDGIYNLGVMEHFTPEEIQKILSEFDRVLKSDGRVVLFWPPENGASVIFLKATHFFLNRIFKKAIQLHPAEITRIESREHASRICEQNGFKMVDYCFGPQDFFTHVTIVLEKRKRDPLGKN